MTDTILALHAALPHVSIMAVAQSACDCALIHLNIILKFSRS
jgi:hypothetical protein